MSHKFHVETFGTEFCRAFFVSAAVDVIQRKKLSVCLLAACTLTSIDFEKSFLESLVVISLSFCEYILVAFSIRLSRCLVAALRFRVCTVRLASALLAA